MADGGRLDRREMLIGVGAAGLAPGGVLDAAIAPIAWSETPAFPKGPLAANPIAARFMAPQTETAWPAAIPLLGPHGANPLDGLRGKTLLVSLWAEWCAPCLAEMPSFSRLNRTYAGRRFQILPILTGSHTIRSYDGARRRLAQIKDADLDTLADGSLDGQALMNTLAQMKLPPQITVPPGAKATGAGLPCLLVVGPQGRLVGRAFGGPKGKDNLWETRSGEGFIRALSQGAAV